MAEYTIDKIEYNGNIYKLQDNVSEYVTSSDIPQVYSSTNTGGYLTMATLPIYDGGVS